MFKYDFRELITMEPTPELIDDIIEYVATALAKQGKKNVLRGSCAYRQSSREVVDGACGVGHLMSDEFAKEYINPTTNVLPIAGLCVGFPHNPRMLRVLKRIQYYHDTSPECIEFTYSNIKNYLVDKMY